ncbi:TIGR03086 family metal-binding protein [Micromonospora sp. KC723]|uniref:TIGR03086 family metal-binding protein n=1 Tax=Micromonospora sp. KC723 TaxID=2530381 RepID=UPI00104F349D|nr:TIGR03086 family metal-binding protein [Micromonospora sp. KC723]TDB72203.1 TIGR03086 family protein [Micromonospora sp. KC723]
MDLLETFRRSLAEFIDRVEQVAPAQWADPTPCPDWDVRALVNHVVAEDRWTVPPLAGRTAAEVGDRFDGDQLGDDPVGAARQAASQAEVAATRPGALDGIVRHRAGDTVAGEYLHQLVAEHLVHGWDLAVAIGANPRLDADAVAVCARWLARQAGEHRTGDPTLPGRPVPADVNAQDRLIAAFGRDPDWVPPR